MLKVIGRRERQMNQIKRGLKDTGVLHMLKERPSLITVVVPRAAKKHYIDYLLLMSYMQICLFFVWFSYFGGPQMVLERIIWLIELDEDDEDHPEVSLD